MSGMCVAKAFGNKMSDVFSDGFITWTAEHFFSRRIKENNALRFINSDDSIHRRFDNSSQPRLILTQFSLFFRHNILDFDYKRSSLGFEIWLSSQNKRRIQ